MPSIADLFISVSADVSNALTGLSDVDKAVAGAGAQFALAKQTAEPFINVMEGVGGVFVSAVDTAAEFEHQMSGVKAVLSPAEVTEFGGALTDLALRLGKDTVFSAQQAAEGIEELIKAGVSAADVLGGAADASVALAAATGVPVSEAADLAAKALNIFGLTANDLGKPGGVVDFLAGTVNATAADMDSLRLGMSDVGTVAAGIGLSFNDTAEALGVLANNGLTANTAGTALKTMLLNLIPTTNKQNEEFAKLGLSTYDAAAAVTFLAKNGIEVAIDDIGAQGDALAKLIVGTSDFSTITKEQHKLYDETTQKLGIVNNAFFDQNGQVKSLAGITDVLHTALAGMTDQQRTAALEIIFGTQGMQAANAMSKETADSINTLTQNIEKISAVDAAKTRLDNLTGSLSQLGGSFETVQITIGTMFLPVIRSVVDALTGLLNAFLTIDPSIQIAVVAILGAIGAVSGLVAAMILLGPALAVIGAGFLALEVAISPVLLPLLAIAAASAALYIAWQTDFAGIRESTESAVTAIQPLLANLQQFFVDMQPVVAVIGQIIGAYLTPAFVVLEAVLRPLMAVLGPLIGLLGDFFNFLSPIRDLLIAIINPVIGLTLAWQDNFLGIRDITLSVWSAIEPVFTSLKTAISEIANGNIGGAVVGVFNALADAARSVVTWVQQLLSGNFTTGLFGLTEDSPAVRCFQGLEEALSNLIPLIQSVFGQIPTILGTLNNVWDVFINATWALGTRIGEALGSLLTYIGQVVQGQLPDILGNLGDPWAVLVNGAWTLGTRIGEALGSLLGFIGEDLGTALPGVIDAVGDVWANLVNGTWALGQRIGEALGSLLGFIGEELGTALPGVINAVGDIWAIFVSGAWDLGTRIGEALGNLLGFIGIELGQALPGVIDGIGDVWGGFVGAAWELGNRIPDAINNVLGFIGTALSSIPSMIDGLGDIWGVLVDGAVAIVQRIGDVLNPIKQVIIDIFGALPAWFTGQFGGGTTGSGGTGTTGTTGTYAPLINIGTLVIASQEEADAFLNLVAQAVLASANRVTVPTGGTNPVL